MDNIKTESRRIKTNSTGSMSREVTKDGVTLLYSYDTIVGYVMPERNPDIQKRCVLVKGNTYSQTSAIHIGKYRDEFGLEPDDTFIYAAFTRRAAIDGVNVLGGWNHNEGAAGNLPWYLIAVAN